MSYNGWANRETWSIALWIGNDEGLYNLALPLATYGEFVSLMRELGHTENGDGVAWNDSGLDVAELDEMMADLS